MIYQKKLLYIKPIAITTPKVFIFLKMLVLIKKIEKKLYYLIIFI